MSRKKSLSISILLVILVLILSSCGKEKEEEIQEEGYVPVETTTVGKGNLRDEKTYTGKVVSDKEVMVIPKMPGKVESVHVALGDRVKKGQTLFVIEQDDIKRNLEQAQLIIDAANSGVKQAESAINSAKANESTAGEALKNSEIELERARTLYEEGAMAKAQLEQVELGFSSTKSQYETAKSGVTQAEIGLEQAKNQLNQAQVSLKQAGDALENTIVTAPIGGLVSLLEVKEGQIAGNDIAAMIVDPSELYMEINVIENIINKISKGQEVLVDIPAARSQAYNSKIEYVSPSVSPQNKLYLVKIRLDNEENLIKPGMTGDVTLNIDEIKDVIFIKRSAVLRDEDSSYVFISKDKKALRKDVEIGSTMGDYVEIKEGLEIGDQLIIKGHNYVEDGGKIKIVEGDA